MSGSEYYWKAFSDFIETTKESGRKLCRYVLEKYCQNKNIQKRE